MNMFTNRDGNHIVMQLSGQNNSIKYYLLTSQGSIVRSTVIETSANGEYPDISGNNDRIYIVYRLGNSLVTKYSTNAGQSWNNVPDYPTDLSNNLCNSLDIQYFEEGNSYNNGLHIVYSLRDSYPYYETYYEYLRSDDNWDYERRKQVTDYPGEVGGFASVAVNSNIVLVTYNWGTTQDPLGNYSQEKTRIRYNSNWLAPQNVTFNNEGSARAKVYLFNNNMYNFYFETWYDLGQWGEHIIVKTKSDVNSNWGGHLQLDQYTSNSRMLTAVAKTSNDRMNLVYYEYNGQNNLIHQYYDGQNWSSKTSIYSNYNYSPQQFVLSSSSNDLYVIWKDNSSNQLKYRQYDAAPLAPVNVSVSAFNGRPKIVWSLNNEPDVRINNNAYYIERRLDTQGNGQWSSWVNIGSVNGQTNSFIDSSITSAGSGPSYAQYRLRAKDIGENFSAFSTTGTINYGDGLEKISIKNFTFELIGNYPNPFNPDTKIMFTIPEPGNVELVFYNSLGETIKNISLNGLTKGEHQYILNSEKFGMNSGIYFYSINFNGNYKFGKMILVK